MSGLLGLTMFLFFLPFQYATYVNAVRDDWNGFAVLHDTASRVGALDMREVQPAQVAPQSGFALDQDTGGAIRAPGRCDVYMGIGDAAGEIGATHEFYVLANAELGQVFLAHEFVSSRFS